MGVLSLFWCLGFVFIKTGLDGFNPLAQGAARGYVPGLLLFAVALARRKTPPPTRRPPLGCGSRRRHHGLGAAQGHHPTVPPHDGPRRVRL